MSETNKRFENLTPEQQKALKAAFRKMILSSLLTGANFGGLLFFSNSVLILANAAFFQSIPLLLVVSIVADIYLL